MQCRSSAVTVRRCDRPTRDAFGVRFGLIADRAPSSATRSRNMRSVATSRRSRPPRRTTKFWSRHQPAFAQFDHITSGDDRPRRHDGRAAAPSSSPAVPGRKQISDGRRKQPRRTSNRSIEPIPLAPARSLPLAFWSSRYSDRIGRPCWCRSARSWLHRMPHAERDAGEQRRAADYARRHHRGLAPEAGATLRGTLPPGSAAARS